MNLFGSSVFHFFVRVGQVYHVDINFQDHIKAKDFQSKLQAKNSLNNESNNNLIMFLKKNGLNRKLVDVIIDWKEP